MSATYDHYRQGVLSYPEALALLLNDYEEICTQYADFEARRATVLAELARLQLEAGYDAAALDALCAALAEEGLGPIAYRIAACKRGEGQV